MENHTDKNGKIIGKPGRKEVSRKHVENWKSGKVEKCTGELPENNGK
jgi:hypothetical protein